MAEAGRVRSLAVALAMAFAARDGGGAEREKPAQQVRRNEGLMAGDGQRIAAGRIVHERAEIG